MVLASWQQTPEEHEKHLVHRTVLDILKEHRLYAKPSKCDFFKDEIAF